MRGVGAHALMTKARVQTTRAPQRGRVAIVEQCEYGIGINGRHGYRRHQVGLLRNLIEKAFDPVKPALALRTMTRAAFDQRLLELLQQIALRVGKLDRSLDLDMHVEIASNARTQTLDALAAQTERLARLRAFRHR